MGDNLSVTLISALPEDSLAAAPRQLSHAAENPSTEAAGESPLPTPTAQPKPRRILSVDTPAPSLFGEETPIAQPTAAPSVQAEFRSAGPLPVEEPSSPAVSVPPADIDSLPEEEDTYDVTPNSSESASATAAHSGVGLDEPSEPESPKLKLGVKSLTPQNELSFDSTPRGRFEGQSPNVVDGEDLDLPPFLRKKK